MKKLSVAPVVSDHANATVEELIDKAFSQIRQLGAAEEASRLFPHGVGSLDLEIGSGGDPKAAVRISLRIAAAPGGSAVDGAATLSPMMEDDVEATFNAEGHHITALIAERDLNKNFPQSMKKVQKILVAAKRSLLDAATYPDDIRNTQPETKPFHFIDIPFEAGGPANPPLPHAPHVISKIVDFSAVLKQTDASAKYKVNALSWLIHLFGDIHQPLHCIEHISELHPAGDRGGNSFLLRGKAKNLHSLWDSSVSFTNSEDPQLAADIMNEHPRSALAADLHITNVESWARSSFRLAKKFAYEPLQENPAAPPTPTKIYIKNTEKVGRRQAALAGYRLSDRLRQILG